MNKPWEVTAVTLTKEAQLFGARAFYRYHVTGVNHYLGGASFSWCLPSLQDPRYDLSRVTAPRLPA